MSILRNIHALFLVTAGILFLLECGANAQQKTPTGGFAGNSTPQVTDALAPETAASVTGVTLNPSAVVGGESSRLRVVLSHAAPVGGVQVALQSADPAVVATPSSVTIPGGHSGVSVPLTTVAVNTTQSVTLTASYSGSTAGADLTVNPSKAAPSR